MLKKKDKVLPIRMDSDFYKRVKTYADACGVSVSYIVRYHLQDIVSKFEAKQEYRAEQEARKGNEEKP